MTQALLRRVCFSAVVGVTAFAWATVGWTAPRHLAHHLVGHHHHRRHIARSDPLPAVRDLLAGFTHQTADYMVDVNLVEEVPARTWSGPGAFQAWSTSLQQAGGAESLATLHSSPRTDRDMTYVLAPVLYSYERRGAVVIEPATIAISLRRQAAGWKVTGWAWAGSNPRAAEQ
ncbi:MAG TPA: hypothetical protein VGI30_08710, partial [Caulobacteraceae bacterium]